MLGLLLIIILLSSFLLYIIFNYFISKNKSKFILTLSNVKSRSIIEILLIIFVIISLISLLIYLIYNISELLFNTNLDLRSSVISTHMKNQSLGTNPVQEVQLGIIELIVGTHYIITNLGGTGSTSLSDFLSNFTWRIDEIFPVIDMSDLTQSVAIVNVLGGLVILLCLFTIVSAFYGNKLIEYFDLENKYPSLAKYIRLRIKFQNYTIIFNFVLLTIVLINQMVINIIVLFNSF